MYYRKRQNIRVEWEPENKKLGKQAIVDVDGTGVSETSELDSDSPISVDSQTADAIRDRYDELVSQP